MTSKDKENDSVIFIAHISPYNDLDNSSVCSIHQACSVWHEIPEAVKYRAEVLSNLQG